MRVVALFAVAAIVWGWQTPPPAPRNGPLEPITAILDAFRSHGIVAIGEAHGNEQGHAFRLGLIRDPRFAALVNDIVVESGNARYQDVIDRFVRGEAVPDAVLRQVWQNTTQPHAIWDRPIYEEFFRAVRGVNEALPRERQLRVLLGDPPIDWDNVRSVADLRKDWRRSHHPAEVVRAEVLAKQRRALIIYGAAHLWHQNLTGKTLVDWLDAAAKGAVFTVMPHPAANLEVVLPDVTAWRAPSITLTRGTVLENQVDAILYLGPPSAMTYSRLSPALCSDAAYREMRTRRMGLTLGIEKAVDVLNKECGGENEASAHRWRDRQRHPDDPINGMVAKPTGFYRDLEGGPRCSQPAAATTPTAATAIGHRRATATAAATANTRDDDRADAVRASNRSNHGGGRSDRGLQVRLPARWRPGDESDGSYRKQVEGIMGRSEARDCERPVD